MKKLVLVLIVLLSFSCQKDYCVNLNDMSGATCCIKCFRSEQQALKFYKNNPTLDLCKFCD